MKATASLTTLQDILASGMLTEHIQKIGEALLHRLSSPVRLVLMGPDSDNKQRVHEMLTAHAIPETIISELALGSQVDFGQADICLWCTSEFGSTEYQVWQDAPDLLKDHSFLVLLATPETAASVFSEDQLDALGDIAAEEFHSLFPITLEPQPTYPSAALDALVVEIAKLVKSGRVADHDSAEFFVRTHRGVLAGSSTAGNHAPDTGPQPSPPTAEVLPEAVEPTCDEAPVELYRKAFDHICKCASQLSSPACTDASDDFSDILSICHQTCETVADMLSESASDAPDFLLLKEDVLRSADKLLLMSLESGVAPAISAVTTLLQTRREMATRMAL
ncbi:hypothetical protein [Roseovarius aestuarii]|uniref:Uncharacterized protein n=1 Tax=Roseovarius aestuarii TaxID=475083 RepID=A0A1X7BVT0_9RHOB|nr:hypothetical protein [Roseovarius aestuarii]SMC13746.1 hypothetical protein ROA7745_03605 [Roseovarius aestuarii]